MIHTPILSLAFITVSLSAAAQYGAGNSGGNDNSESRAAAPGAQSVPRGISADDWSSIVAAREAQRHAAYSVDGGFAFRTPGQRWTIQFDGRGFVTKPDAGAWTWGLELKSYGAAGRERAVAGIATASAHGQRLEYAWDAALTEWYRNDARGLEHGYTVQSPPAAGGGLLMITLAVRGDLRPAVQAGGRNIYFTNSSGAAVLSYSGLAAADADGKALPAKFQSTKDGLQLSVDARGARYPLTIDPIAQQIYLKASNTEGDDQFGTSVSASGNTIVVGAISEDSNAVGVNGDQSNNAAGSSGAAYVFVRNQGIWSQQAFLKASNTGSGDEFGGAVAISGDTIAVGARMEDSNATGVNGNQTNNLSSNSGAVYVFVRNGTTWTQQAYLKASNTGSNDNFGQCVAVSGNTIAVGALGEDSNATGINGNQANNTATNSGAVYVFVRNGAAWSQEAYVKPSNTDAFDQYSASVALSGDTLIVGASNECSIAGGVNGNQSDNTGSSSGAAYIYKRTAGVWTQEAYVKPGAGGNQHVGDQFGTSVAISGDTAVVGAINDHFDGAGNYVSAGYSAGAAYVYIRNGSTWALQAKLKASTVESQDQFGWYTAISGNCIVVSSISEGSGATGINGNESDNSANASGAVWVYKRAGTAWSQTAYVKSSNTEAQDTFGYSIALSGDLLVVGANWEDSNATGLNGDQTNNSALNAGAVYVFDLDYNPGTFVYGTGTPGCAGTETLGVTHAPMVNSPNFAITCDNAPPSSLGLGLVTDSPDFSGSDPFGLGVVMHSDFVFASEILAFDFYSDGTGYAETFGTAIPNDNSLIGKTYYACALWAWTTCLLPPYNLSTSRGLAITILVP